MPAKREEVAALVQNLTKKDLFLHMISALRQESYLYAAILKEGIKSRTFSSEETRESSHYPMLKGIMD
jgi:hypothetical protein